MNVSVLKGAGIDYENGVKRFLGDKELYESALGVFLEDGTMEDARAAYEAGDITELSQYVRTLKGSCGSADMTKAYMAARGLLDAIHCGHTRQQLDECFRKLEEAYYEAKEGIRTAVG